MNKNTMYIQMANSTGALMLQTMLYLANQTSNSIYDLPPAQANGECLGHALEGDKKEELGNEK